MGFPPFCMMTQRKATVFVGWVAALAGALYLAYVETATGPGERVARARGCLLCHRDSFRELLPCLRQWTPGTPLAPALEEALRRAHPQLTQGEEEILADFLRAQQLPALAQLHRGKRGESLYRARCAACHGVEGEGKAGQYPPLRASEWLTEEPSRLPDIMTQGLRGPIRVRGEAWDAVMLAPGVEEGEESQLLIEYLRHTFEQPVRP